MMIQNLNWKFESTLEYQNIKKFLQKVMIQSFVIKNFKNTVWWRYVIERKLLECFAKKNFKRQIKQSLELKTNQGNR